MLMPGEAAELSHDRFEARYAPKEYFEEQQRRYKAGARWPTPPTANSIIADAKSAIKWVAHKLFGR